MIITLVLHWCYISAIVIKKQIDFIIEVNMIDYIACFIAGAIFGFYLKSENEKEMKSKHLNEYDLEREKPSDSYIERYLEKIEWKEKIKQFQKKDFHDINYVQYFHNTQRGHVIYNLPIGNVGSKSFLLNENHQVYSGDGFHEINLTNNYARTGARDYRFTEHIKFIKSGKAEVFRLGNNIVDIKAVK